jgi:hypothetical protein
MDEKYKSQPIADDLSAEALEQTMEEVVETLELTHRAAGFFQKRNRSPRELARSEHVRRKAAAMLDAAAERCSDLRSQDESLDDISTVH